MTRTRTRPRAPRRRTDDPTSLYVRGFDSGIVSEIKRRAGSRALTNADYITRLVALHARLLDATENPQMIDMLASVGLSRVET